MMCITVLNSIISFPGIKDIPIIPGHIDIALIEYKSDSHTTQA